MKTILISIFIVLSISVQGQLPFFNSYSFKQPQLIGSMSVSCSGIDSYIYILNKGGRGILRYGILICSYGCSYMEVDNPNMNQIEWYDGAIENHYYRFTDDFIVENTPYSFRGFIQTSDSTVYYTSIIETTSPTTCSGTLPTVYTCPTPSNVTETSASFCGQVLDDGGGTISAYGIVYSTSDYPTLSDNVVYGQSDPYLGFYANASGMEAETNYKFRAFTTTNIGTAYGDQYNFTTEEAEEIVAPYIRSRSASVAANSGTTTGYFYMPQNIVTGDYVIATILERTYQYRNTFTVPSGWTLIDTTSIRDAGSGNYTASMMVIYKIANSSEAGNLVSVTTSTLGVKAGIAYGYGEVGSINLTNANPQMFFTTGIGTSAVTIENGNISIGFAAMVGANENMSSTNWAPLYQAQWNSSPYFRFSDMLKLGTGTPFPSVDLEWTSTVYTMFINNIILEHQ